MSARRRSANFETIRRGLAEVWDTQGRKFVTFEACGRAGVDADRWVQYLDGEVNLRWTLAEEPGPELARRGVEIPRGAFVSWHVPGANVVFAVGDVLIDDVAQFIEGLFAAVVAADAASDIAARVELHG